MTRIVLILCIVLCTASTAFAEADAPGNYIVSANTLNVRIGADTSAKLVAKLQRHQKVEVREVKNGWARISDYYDGAADGVSGNVARWVYGRHLTSKAPLANKIRVNPAVIDAIGASEDLDEYQELFAQVSQRLVNSGECKLSDFRDIGGWWKSAAHNPGSIYYTYCGGATNDDRIFVDTLTGETFR